MPFSQKMLCALEFDKITARLSEHAATEGARARARSLMPSDDVETVEKRQNATADAVRLVHHKGYPSFSAPASVPAAADRAYKGAVLSPRELLDIASLLYSTRALLDYIHTDKPYETSLDAIFARLMPERSLEDDIRRSILSEDMIADEASPALADIRRKIRNTNNKIKDTLQSYIGGNRLKYLQENIVTMRNGRYVVPVKAEYRNELRGLVHDTSASGATLFVEPMTVVEANNELKSLGAAEEHEIERILSELSARVGEASSLLSSNHYVITDLSFVFACAAYAIELGAERPRITAERCIDLKRARHPLLPRSTVVPIDVSIGREYDTLIVTGPNTGGKTVTLKTIGLLTLMAQAGLHIPAQESSEIGVFDSILVDIGDEQSIEASLSTFSSHMVTIVEILSSLSEHTLVLFDELGSGTDPVEGAALAGAILEHVKASGALSAATTHYAELKAYALKTPRVQNASCEFDVQTLRPTYRLIVGTPGKSNAFAISEKLGLSSAIIERAEALIEREDKRFEDVIERLDTDRMEMEREKEKAERLRTEYEAFKRDAEEMLRRRIAKEEEEISRQLLKARQILDSARASSEFIFHRLDEVQKAEDRETRRALTDRAKAEVRDRLRAEEAMLDGAGVRHVSLEDEYHLPRPLKVGDTVYLVSLGREGQVTAIDEKRGLYAVTSGILKTKVKEDELRLVEGNVTFRTEAKKPKVSEGKVKRTPVSSFKTEIDVRGMIGDDAWFVIDKYLDDAVLASVSPVRIIHGKGTGALKAALWKYFKADRRIASFQHAAYGAGDAGVTVIDLKK